MGKCDSVVLICPEFFDYKKLIENQLAKRFSSVLSFSDRPPCSSINKALIKYNLANYNYFVSRLYSQKLLEKITPSIENITTVIIIKGTCVSPILIQRLKSLNAEIRVVVYCWDSIANSNGFAQLAAIADKSMSFDFIDCKQYQLEYLPLFYPDDNSTVAPSGKLSKKYQYSFVGSYHGDRAKLLYQILNSQKSHFSASFIKIYFQSKMQFCVFYLLDPYLRKCPKEWVTFDVIDRDIMNGAFAESYFIIDIHHKGQSGLTMRTWEILNLGYKLLTTNAYVLLHQPISSIEILERTNGTIWSNDQKRKFIAQAAIDNVSKTHLSLSHWLDTLLK